MTVTYPNYTKTFPDYVTPNKRSYSIQKEVNHFDKTFDDLPSWGAMYVGYGWEIFNENGIYVAIQMEADKLCSVTHILENGEIVRYITKQCKNLHAAMRWAFLKTAETK